MAVKFSEFTQKSDATTSSITEIVGYLSSGQLNVRVVPSALDTTYTFATSNGATPALTLAGTKTGETIADTLVTLSALNATALTGSGTNAISIDSTAYALSATDNADPAQNTPVVLTGTGGGDSGTDTVNIIGSGTVGVTSSSGTITITGSGGGGVTSFTNTNGTFVSAATANSSATGAVTTGVIDLSATGTPTASNFLRGDNTWATPAGGFSDFNITGDSGTPETVATGQTVTIAGGTLLGSVVSSPDTVTVNHDSVTRSDTTSSDSPAAGGTVDLVKTITTSTEGHVTAVDVSTVTWPAGGAPTLSKTQLTGNNSTTIFALTGAPAGLTVANLNIFISGVYQNQKDSGGTDNYSVGSGASPNLTFVTAPPVTAANGIDVVITS